MKKGEELWNARARLARALENHDRCAPNTYGRRDAIHKHIPDAIEALVEAKFAALAHAAGEVQLKGPMSDAPVTARELIEFAAPNAAGMFEKSGELRPLWHVVCANGEHGVIASPLGEGGTQKNIFAAAMREVFRRLDAVALVFMCESWMRTGHEADFDVDKAGREGIHEDPLRVECLWFQAEDAEGQITAYQLIDRPDGPEGRGVLQPLKWLDRLSRMEGRYVGMLPVKGKGH